MGGGGGGGGGGEEGSNKMIREPRLSKFENDLKVLAMGLTGVLTTHT